ncbi:toll/interleukin-1 receptor domain-containing protein [Rouxiella aceris]|uniref:toll/interleukin-1 receptor domain-containing protein n=1 Tax=Rouxiella aceris TaxID=2703884 RepID=UPI0028528B29|nr:toll/interleukin-1 receptor domain-containing protein [Rouxiella aceris]
MGAKVFISYSHKDELFKDSLKEHLSPLLQKGIISTWDDRDISAGNDWAQEISVNLEAAEVILFLISPSFLASEYCSNIEAKRAMELHDEHKSILIPIVVRPCEWSECDYSRFQAVPKDAKPVALWSNEDEAWLDAVRGIKKIAQSVLENNEKKNLS